MGISVPRRISSNGTADSTHSLILRAGLLQVLPVRHEQEYPLAISSLSLAFNMPPAKSAGRMGKIRCV